MLPSDLIDEVTCGKQLSEVNLFKKVTTGERSIVVV
jgi:hypothetical protein